MLVLGGLAVSSFRRYVLRPAGLQLTIDAALVNTLIAGLMVTYLLAEGFRLVVRPAEKGVWVPVGNWLAGPHPIAKMHYRQKGWRWKR